MPIPTHTLSSPGQRSGTTNPNGQARFSKPTDSLLEIETPRTLHLHTLQHMRLPHPMSDWPCTTNISPQKTSPCGKPIHTRDHPRLLPLIQRPPLSQGRLRRHRHIRHSPYWQRRHRSNYKIPRCHKRVQEVTHPTRSSPSLSHLPRICAPSPNTFSLVPFLNCLANNKTFVPIF